MPEIVIRDADYAADYAALHARCFKKAWNESMMRQTLLLSGALGLMAYDAETPAGFLIYAYGGDQADIVTFGVVPEYRGKGFSDALLNGSFAFLKIRNIDRVFLEVAVDNPHAISLYRRTGFEQIGKRPQYYRRGNEAIDALVMARGVG